MKQELLNMGPMPIISTVSSNSRIRQNEGGSRLDTTNSPEKGPGPHNWQQQSIKQVQHAALGQRVKHCLSHDKGPQCT